MALRILLSWLCLASVLEAAVGYGSTREEVIETYGPPRGQSQAGRREILTYADGRVVLEEGRVVTLDFKKAPPAREVPPPVSAPPPPPIAVTPVPTSPPVAAAPSDPWLVDFEAAKRLAAQQKKRLLVLFTGTDWCPPCQTFQAEVAYEADFLKLATMSFILVKVDWLRNLPQSSEETKRVAALRREYGISSYPTLLVLAADGTRLMRVDTRKARQADSVADFYLQAVDEARQATRDGKPVSSSWWPF